MRRVHWALGLFLMVTLIVAPGCGTSGDSANSSGEATEPKVESSSAASKGSPGSGKRVAPPFTLPKIGGGELALDESSGSVRLVDFWATWCAPCREEIPFLNELQTEFGDRGFEVIAISSESKEEIEDFLVEYPTVYTNLIGTETLESEYKVLGMPTGYLVDGEGFIVEVFFGAKPEKVVRDKIEELLEAS